MIGVKASSWFIVAKLQSWSEICSRLLIFELRLLKLNRADLMI